MEQIRRRGGGDPYGKEAVARVFSFRHAVVLHVPGGRKIQLSGGNVMHSSSSSRAAQQKFVVNRMIVKICTAQQTAWFYFIACQYAGLEQAGLHIAGTQMVAIRSRQRKRVEAATKGGGKRCGGIGGLILSLTPSQHSPPSPPGSS